MPGSVKSVRAHIMRGLLWSALPVALLTALAGWKYGWLWTIRPDPARFPVRGIDVSHHQGEIDWADVRAEGWQFAWIKATEGATWTDPRFDENRAAAAAAGVPWGAYHFFGFCSAPEAQAAHFLAVLQREGRPGPDLRPVVDVEGGGNCAARPAPAELRARTVAFMEIVAAATGQAPILYIVEDDARALYGDAGPPGSLHWRRDLYREPPGPWDLWQYHARGWVSGIGAFTDINVFRGSPDDFRRAMYLTPPRAPGSLP